MAKKTPMDESELAALLGMQERMAVSYWTSEIASEQAAAIDYYYGLSHDKPRTGRSSVVDHVVAEVVDNALAALLKPFVSAEDAVVFNPRKAEDEQAADQATEYVNFVFQNDNNGFLILHDWFKAALLEKLATVKIWWHDKSGPQKASHKGISAIDVENLIAKAEAGEIKDLEITNAPDEDSFDATFTEDYEDGCVRIECIPSEEFLISPMTRNADEAPYIAHRAKVSRSDLIGMGFDAKVVDTLPTWNYGVQDDPRSQARYRDEEWQTSQTDKSQETIQILHEFPLVDYDGDGISERRAIIRSGATILYNEVADDHPFALLCPVPMPHKVYGLSLADQVMDLQRVSSTLTRQMLDNLYLHNNPRPELPEGAERMDGTTLEDLQTTAPGAIIRTRMAGQLSTFTVPFVGDKVLAALEWADQQQHARTGINGHGQSLDTDALKKPQTATQAAIDDNKRNERVEMIARIFAETGVKQLFRKILRLVVTHQPRERVIRLRNEWVQIDPRGWDAEMDMSISVGIGVGNKQEQAASMAQALEVSERLAMSPYAGLVTADNVYNQVKKLFNALGIKNTDAFITDPKNAEPQPEQPDPEAMKVQADAQAQQAKLAMEQQNNAAQMDLARQKAALDAQIAQEQGEQRLELERQKAAAEMELAQQKAQAEFDLAVRQQDYEFELARRSAAHDAAMGAVDLANNRPGGDLDK